MIGKYMFATAAAAFYLLMSAAAFDPKSNTNVATYWGQGPDQERLSHFCKQSYQDIIMVGFVNLFPEQGPGGYPGTNFGNQCDGTTFTNPDGEKTELLKGCHQIAEDIPECQAAGKTILLSIGGDNPGYKLGGVKGATDFGNFLWKAFGPVDPDWDGPRPFENATVDGFDLDIELGGDVGYATLARVLRENFDKDQSGKFYLSAAPQCVIPDAQLSDAIRQKAFDFIFVQFYNTLACSARSWISDREKSGFTFDKWVTEAKNSGNPDAKVFIGLPGSTDAVENDTFYLPVGETERIIDHFINKHPEQFGGVMVWEATYSENNRVNGRTFAENMKFNLNKFKPKAKRAQRNIQDPARLVHAQHRRRHRL